MELVDHRPALAQHIRTKRISKFAHFSPGLARELPEKTECLGNDVSRGDESVVPHSLFWVEGHGQPAEKRLVANQ